MFAARLFDRSPNDPAVGVQPAGGRRTARTAGGRTARRQRPAAFTLLEVILALGLTAVLMAIVAGALRQYLFLLSDQQREIERMQLARSVLTLIGDDLRAAFQYKPADVTGLKDLSASQMASFGLGAIGGEDLAATEEFEQLMSEMEMGQDMTAQIAHQAAPPDRPGLYGNPYELQVDISRLPRLDRYSPVLAQSLNTDQWVGTDLQTVAYFVQPGGVSQAHGDHFGFSPEQVARGGLFRREIDRALGNSAEQVQLNIDEFTRLIAPEVVAIEFAYFDGVQWHQEWNSDLKGGFPAAVEVIIGIDTTPPELLAQQGLLQPGGMMGGGMMGIDPDRVVTYRTVVHLPIAEILVEDEWGGMFGSGFGSGSMSPSSSSTSARPSGAGG